MLGQWIKEHYIDKCKKWLIVIFFPSARDFLWWNSLLSVRQHKEIENNKYFAENSMWTIWPSVSYLEKIKSKKYTAGLKSAFSITRIFIDRRFLIVKVYEFFITPSSGINWLLLFLDWKFFLTSTVAIRKYGSAFY